MRFNISLGPTALVLGLSALAPAAYAQSFRVQCPTSTITHPDPKATGVNNSEPAYNGPTLLAPVAVTTDPNTGKQVGGYLAPAANVNGAIKCQQISGGDGYSTMADGTQTYMFSFGPLSGLADLAAGQPATEFPSVFNTTDAGVQPGDPATTDGATDIAPVGTTASYQIGSGGSGAGTGNAPTLGGAAFTFNGAIGLAGDPLAPAVANGGKQATAVALVTAGVIDIVNVTSGGSGYNGPVTVTIDPPTGCVLNTTCFQADAIATVANGVITGVTVNAEGGGYTTPPAVHISAPSSNCSQSNNSGCLDGHVDPRQVMDVGVMNGNIPAPLMAIDEDDEFFLTLTNVGMIMRPDLFEQHTVHFHGYPNASAVYDGVPDASVAINIGGSFTYYYLAPDAGTYFWHCHITPPEHLQMGMVGQLYVRPRQNRVPASTSLFVSLQKQQLDLRTACNTSQDILCSTPLPPKDSGAVHNNNKNGTPTLYAYNDGDGSTSYDVEYPLQIHGFDPNFHFVGMTFNAEGFVDMKDKYFLLNGRSYPDTASQGPQATQSSDGRMHYSQPLNAIVNIPVGGKALLRISDLDVSEYQTLASLGIRMHVIGYNAKLLRDQAGNNLDYFTNSITLGGGESLDVILDASDTNTYKAGQQFFLYTPNLDHLSNDAENFGGLMTVVNICNKVDPTSKVCT